MQVLSAFGVVPVYPSGGVPSGIRYQVQPATPPPGYQTFSGMAVTPWIDVGTATYIGAELDIHRSIPKGTLAALAHMAAGSWQAEYSADGNNGVLQATPVAVAQDGEKSYQLPPLTTMTKLLRYVKYRYAFTSSSITVEGTILTPPTVPSGTVQSCAYTGDGLGFLQGVATTPYLNAYPYTDSTTPLGTQTTGTALSSAPNQVRFCPAPLSGTPGNNQYYAACVTTTTLVIQAFTAPTMAFGAQTIVTPTPSTPKSVSWHPGIVNPRQNALGVSVPCGPGLFVAVAGTGGISIYAFNPANGVLGAAQPLSNTPNVGNITCIEFSPDGNFLLVGGGTSPYVTVLPVYIAQNGGVFSLNLDAAIAVPTSLPNAALRSCKWHPTMEAIYATTGTTTYLFGWAFLFNSSGAWMQGRYAAFGNAIPMPTSGAPVAFPDNLAISPDGGWLAVADATSTYFHDVYALKDPATGPNVAATVVVPGAGTTAINAITWHPNGMTLTAWGATSVFGCIYPWLVAVDMAVTVQGSNMQ